MEIINKDNQIKFNEINGRRTLSRNGETLVEGVHFLVDGEYDHLPTLDKDNAVVGNAYKFCDGYMILKSVRNVTDEEIKKFQLIYKMQFTAQTFTSGGSYEIGGGLCGSQC